MPPFCCALTQEGDCSLETKAASRSMRKDGSPCKLAVGQSQLGRGVQLGTEAAGHAALGFLDNYSSDCQALLKINFSDAFDSLFRLFMLEETDEWLLVLLETGEWLLVLLETGEWLLVLFSFTFSCC
jgi:hypothetical protein